MLVFCLMAPESLEWSFTLGGKVWLGNPEPLIFKSCRDRSLLIQNKAVVKRMKLTIGLVIPIVLMGWSIQEHQSKHIQVPHAIDACEKGAVHLDCDTTPLPMAFGHLWGRKKKNSDTELKPRRNTTPTEEPTDTKIKSLLHIGKVRLHFLIWIILVWTNWFRAYYMCQAQSLVFLTLAAHQNHLGNVPFWNSSMWLSPI